jgi:hypothetical protein
LHAGKQYTIDYRIGAHRLKLDALKTMRPDPFEVPEIDADTEAALRKKADPLVKRKRRTKKMTR